MFDAYLHSVRWGTLECHGTYARCEAAQFEGGCRSENDKASEKASNLRLLGRNHGHAMVGKQ